MLKKIFCSITAFLLVFAILPAASSAAAASFTVVLNGQQLSSDVAPAVVNGAKLVPLRVIFEALGSEIQWDEKTQTITAKQGNTTITHTIGQKVAYKDNRSIPLEAPSALIGGRSLVPLGLISESFGAKTAWNDKTATIEISSAAVNDHGNKRIIYMSAIEPKGTTTIEKEPFPEASPPKGNGYKLKKLDEKSWETSVYRWEPGLIVANEGEEVELHIWGINGAKHRSTIDGYNLSFVVERGKLTIVKFKADKTGIFNIICHDHAPSMQTQLLVLPREK